MRNELEIIKGRQENNESTENLKRCKTLYNFT